MASSVSSPIKRRPSLPPRILQESPIPDFCPVQLMDSKSKTVKNSLDRIDKPASVDAINVEESIKAKVIGDRIRRLRLKRSMGLVELGKRTEMSASFLSQLETGKVVPTLRNLSRIALVFGKELSYFFVDDKKNQFKRSRARDRVRLPMGDKSSPILIAESMSALIPDRSLVPCIAEFLPNTQPSAFEPHTFKGQEFVYVIHGTLILSTDNDRQELGEADIAWVDGLTKRKYFCPDGKPAKAMIITCPKKD